MRKSPRRFSDEEKLAIIRDYYSSGLSLGACVRKYGLSGESSVIRWREKFKYHEEIVSLQPEPISEEEMANRSKEEIKDENAQLKKRIRNLEKALEFSRLETLARDMMIDKAEEYFDIQIRKKSGAK